MFLGEFDYGTTVWRKFTTVNSTGAPTALSSAGITVYRNGSTVPDTTGVTLTASFNTITGLNHLQVDMSTVGYYSSAASYQAIISSGAASEDLTGYVVAEWRLRNQQVVSVSTAVSISTASFISTAQAIATIGSLPASSTKVDMVNMSTAAAQQVNAEVDASIETYNLDHLVNALVLTHATIETVTSQTQLVIPATADAPDDDAYNDATAVLIDGTDPNQKSVRTVLAYDAGTRTITLDSAPDFTVTTADTITLLAMPVSYSRINTEMTDVLTVDTHAEVGQGAPPATASLLQMWQHIYKSWRNPKDNDGAVTNFYADDGTTVDAKQTTTESAGVVTKGKVTSGP